MAERDNKKYLLKRVAEVGGIARKVRWEGRNNAPDWRVLLPWRCFWFELKDEGEVPNVMQKREHAEMVLYREAVHWADSEESINYQLFRRDQGASYKYYGNLSTAVYEEDMKRLGIL